MDVKKVLIHIVTWNSAETIQKCIEKASAQDGFILGESLFIRITDNASSDGTVAIVTNLLRPGIFLLQNGDNLGFCGAHNQGISELITQDYDAMVILNPDVGLEPTTVACMVSRISDQARIGLVTPKLLRALPSLEAIHPPVLDAAGMILARSCRHFDRGAGDWDWGQFDQGEFVFGGTGACLLVSQACARDLCLPGTIPDDAVFAIYPQLRKGSHDRAKFFDEAFFAYREDADVSWRARLLRWRCWYEPSAGAAHVRAVTPERRASVSPSLNAYSVRNRFLLQLNNWRWSQGIVSFIYGIVVRNLIVIGGVLTFELSSLPGLREAILLTPRAIAIRAWISERRSGR